LPGPALDPAGDEDPRPALEGLGDVLGQTPPGVDREEVRLLDLLAVAVGVEAVDGDPELDHCLAGRGVAELGIPGEVPNDGDGVHAAPPVLIGAAFPLSTSAGSRVWPVAVKRRPKKTRATGGAAAAESGPPPG